MRLRVSLLNALVAILVASTVSFGAEAKASMVKWRTYTDALEFAKTSTKLVFVDLYADWCVPCRVMDKNVYSDPTVASLLNNRFISAKLDVDSKDTITCDGQRKTVDRCYHDVWELNAIPAFVLIAPKGLTILTVTDSMSPQEMRMLLYKFLEKEKEWIER
ncbi:MAG: thioredoxin family protein [Fibrobacter sp.]|nr:thioredoxin family protein [Fibrobacter sp.]